MTVIRTLAKILKGLVMVALMLVFNVVSIVVFVFAMTAIFQALYS